MTEDEMVGWHHRLNRQEFEQTPGDGEDREAWCGAAQAGSQSRTGLSDRTTSPRSSAAASRKGNCGPGNLQKALGQSVLGCLPLRECCVESVHGSD